MCNDSDNKKRQAEVFKEGLNLYNDVNDFVKEIKKDIHDINNALWINDINLMRDCAIIIKNKYPNFTLALSCNICLFLPYNIRIEDMTCEQLYNVLVAEKIALQNIENEYGLSQAIKRGLELAAKWRLEDIMKR